MSTTLAYSLLGLVAALVLAGAIWTVAAAWGAAQGLIALSELRTRTSELEIAFESLREQYEISNNRSAAKIGKLRRTLARERGEDDEDDEDTPAAPLTPPPATAQLIGKDELRRKHLLKGRVA